MEQVFVVRRADFFGGDWAQGFTPLCGAAADVQLAALTAAGRFVDRPAAERDPSLKQLIPYCVLTHGSDIFLFQRQNKGSEGRLHGLYSIGLGGHVGPEDGPADDPILLENGLLRELHEELVLPDFDRLALRLVGLCNDDSNPVGSVHFGLVYRLDLAHQAFPRSQEIVRIREIHKLQGGFRPLVELRDLWDDPQRFESWSQIVIEALFNLPRQGEVPTSTPSD